MLDALHSRLIPGKLSPAKFSPVPDEIFVNLGENAPPAANDVPNLLAALRAASSPATNLFLIVPFSGRARVPLAAGYAAYRRKARSDRRAFLMDLGDNPYLTDSGPTMLSVDGQHPLAILHAFLAAQIVEARSRKLSKLPKRSKLE
jgi:hypothetical protein